MPPLLHLFLEAFIPLFVAIDPVGLAAVYLVLASGVADADRRRITLQAVWTGGGVALLFLFLGRTLFSAIGITVSDFKIAGGLILFVLAGRDLIQPASAEPRKLTEDFGVVPLGMPLIAGPAVITTLLIIAPAAGYATTLAALVANLAIVVFTLAYAERLGRILSPTGLRAVSKIVALLLAAIAISMIRNGLRE